MGIKHIFNQSNCDPILEEISEGYADCNTFDPSRINLSDYWTRYVDVELLKSEI